MARGGGARAWLFLKRNPEYGDAFEACPNEAPAFEDAPFPLRRQTRSERSLGRFGVHRLAEPLRLRRPALAVLDGGADARRGAGGAH